MKCLIAATWGITEDITYVLQFWLNGRQKYALQEGIIPAWRKANSEVSRLSQVGLKTDPTLIYSLISSAHR